MTSSNGKFSTLLGFYEGNPPVTSGIPSQSQLWCFLWSEQAIIWTKAGILLIGVEPMLEYCQLYPGEHISMKFSPKYNNLTCGRWRLFVSASIYSNGRMAKLKEALYNPLLRESVVGCLMQIKVGWLNQRPCEMFPQREALCITNIFASQIHLVYYDIDITSIKRLPPDYRLTRDDVYMP